MKSALRATAAPPPSESVSQNSSPKIGKCYTSDVGRSLTIFPVPKIRTFIKRCKPFEIVVILRIMKHHENRWVIWILYYKIYNVIKYVIY